MFVRRARYRATKVRTCTYLGCVGSRASREKLTWSRVRMPVECHRSSSALRETPPPIMVRLREPRGARENVYLCR